MGVIITRDDIIAYAEIDYIIHHMNEKYIQKVPEKLLNFFDTMKDPTYIVNINPRQPLTEQGLKIYTLELVALLHLKYWCEDEARKNELYQKMLENQEKLDSQMREKYDIDNVFGSNVEEYSENNEQISKKDIEYKKIEAPLPQNLTKYHEIQKDNPDIQDYTDVEDDNLKKYFNQETDKLKELDKKEEEVLAKIGFFGKIINKIKSMFVKK